MIMPNVIFHAATSVAIVAMVIIVTEQCKLLDFIHRTKAKRTYQDPFQTIW